MKIGMWVDFEYTFKLCMKYSSCQLLENSAGLNQCNKTNTDMVQ